MGSSVSSFCGISSFRNVSGEFSGSSVKAAVSPCHINFQTCSCIPIIITIVIIIIIMKAEGIATLSNKLPNLLESLSRVGKLLTRQSPMSKSFKRISFSSLKICLLSSLTKCFTWVSLVRNSGEFCGLCLFPLLWTYPSVNCTNWIGISFGRIYHILGRLISHLWLFSIVFFASFLTEWYQYVTGPLANSVQCSGGHCCWKQEVGQKSEKQHDKKFQDSFHCETPFLRCFKLKKTE